MARPTSLRPRNLAAFVTTVLCGYSLASYLTADLTSEERWTHLGAPPTGWAPLSITDIQARSYAKRGNGEAFGKDSWICGYDIKYHDAPYGCPKEQICVNETDSAALYGAYHYMECCPRDKKGRPRYGYCSYLQPGGHQKYNGLQGPCLDRKAPNTFKITTTARNGHKSTSHISHGTCTSSKYPECYGYSFSGLNTGYEAYICAEKGYGYTATLKMRTDVVSESYSYMTSGESYTIQSPKTSASPTVHHLTAAVPGNPTPTQGTSPSGGSKSGGEQFKPHVPTILLGFSMFQWLYFGKFL